MLDELGDEMKRYIKDLEDNIETEKDLKYICDRSRILFNVIFSVFNRLANQEDENIKEIKRRQKKHEKRMEEIESKMEYLDENIEHIYKDIYEDEEGDFQIICPYCNYEFSADIDENEVEIFCPDCNNPIELDWSENTEK